MKKLFPLLLPILIPTFIACSDMEAYHSCKQTLLYSMEEATKVTSLLDIERLENQMNDTLTKYGHASMNHDMIEEIKVLKDSCIRMFQERIKELKESELFQEKRIVDMPGIGLVEIKSPPEV